MIRWLERRRAAKRWARHNQEETHCLCGRPATVWIGYGPAVFGRCKQHASVPLTAVWEERTDGTFTPVNV